ncbi:hypothetical protein HS125_12655 [bacterium]|nr:hypothetical protein [bacterium]
MAVAWLAALTPSAGALASILRTPDSFTLRNEHISLTLREVEGRIELTQLVSGETGREYDLSGCGPRIHLRGGRVLTLADFLRSIGEERMDYTDRQKGFAFSLVNTDADMELYLVFELGHEDRFIRHTVQVSSSTSEEEFWVERVDLFAGPLGDKHDGGGMGQPLWIDDSLFVGAESPAAYNVVQDGSVYLSVYHDKKVNRERDFTWTVGRVVFGAAPAGAARETFVEHYVPRMRSAAPPLVIYNTKYDLAGAEVNPASVAGRLRALSAAIASGSGVALAGAVLEEDWGERNSLLGFNLGRFPGGTGSVRSLPQMTAYDFGLGLSLSGGRTNVAWAREQGYEADRNGRYLLMNGPRYHEDVKARLEAMGRAEDIIFVKHLDLQFASQLGEDGRNVGASEGFGSNFTAFTELVEAMRGARTSHQWYAAPAWDSPWWVRIVDGVGIAGRRDKPLQDWRQPAVLARDAALTAAGGELHDFLVNTRMYTTLPLVVSDEIVASARSGLGATDEALERWSDCVLLALARGSRITELSVDASLLGPAQAVVLGRMLAWADVQREFLSKARWYGGDPRRGELYGFVVAGIDQALVVLRNPTLYPVAHEISMEELFGSGPGRLWAWVAYPYQQKLHDRLNRSQSVGLTVNGLETVAVEIESAVTARERADLSAFWDVPVEATTYLQVGSRGVVVARPVTSVSAELKVETDPLTQVAELGVLLSGSERASREYRVHARINGASVAVGRELSGPGWQMLCFPLAPGEADARVWLEENATVAERRTRSFSVWGLVSGVPDFVTPSLAIKTLADARRLPVIHYPGHRNVTPIVAETALPQSVYRASELEGEAVLRRARAARILMQVFGSDAGSLADKRVLLNGKLVGPLPPNQEPVDSWQSVTLSVPAELLPEIGARNRLVIENPAGDYFKVKDIALMIDAGVDSWRGSEMVRTVYSSAEDWPHREGTVFSGRSPEIELVFRLRRGR